MAITLEELHALASDSGLNVFVDRDRNTVLLMMQGIFGSHNTLMSVELEGQFFQIRTLGALYCPADHPNWSAVVKLLATVNYQTRFVKFGWDPSDGEINAAGDVWIMDGTLTAKQFERIRLNFFPIIDLNFQRLRLTMDTGQDPGDDVGNLPGASGIAGLLEHLPPDVRAKLKALIDEDDEPPEI
ncbi:hypothetical protein CCR95_18415 [Thiocystis minor]|uniref:YbjN domain-containing protein n=1 Tax=Thiocystis minor TaxID=61597 RepID=UPI0019112FE7|nr:YbjN domain-containing protein [Thiocystis minor]MBK5965996.1 hypothetical protein [Thiocystis minor]